MTIGAIVIVFFILSNASKRNKQVTQRSKANKAAWRNPVTRGMAKADSGLGWLLWIVFIAGVLVALGIVPTTAGLALLGGK